MKPVTATRAEFLRCGNRFTYTGAFIYYHVLLEPVPDESYPGRVTFEAIRNGLAKPITIRLAADQVVLREDNSK